MTRVLIETSDGETSWDTIGVAGSILAASWRALTDGLAYGLIRQGVAPRPKGLRPGSGRSGGDAVDW